MPGRAGERRGLRGRAAGGAGAAALAALLAAAGPGPARAEPPAPPARHTLGVIPYFTPEKIHRLWQPVLAYLGEHTPARWELVLGRDHDELVRALCAGEVDVAFLGPVPYGKALRACDARPLLVNLGPDGRPFYRAVIATADARLGALAQLRGRRFAIFERSTAAHYVPLQMLAAAGVRAAEVTLVRYVSQDKVVAALLAGEVDAGGVKESLFEKFRGAGLRPVAVSGPLPQFVFAASPRLATDAGEALAAALLAVRPDERGADRELVRGWDPELAHGFSRAPADYREQVRALLDAVAPP